jgi:hypothetical protein
MATKRKTKAAPARRRYAVLIEELGPNDEHSATARTLTRPEIQAAATMQTWDTNHEVNALARESKALARLATDPTLQRAFVLGRGDPMILGMALRGIAYGKLEIPAARCDPRSLPALLDEHGQPQKVQ